MEFPYRYDTIPPETPAGILAGVPFNIGTAWPGPMISERFATVQVSPPGQKIAVLAQTIGLRLVRGPILSMIFGTQLSAYAIPGQQPEPAGYEFK